MKYSQKQLHDLFIADLDADIEQAEKQAINGPFYPEKGITRESLLNYANTCRQQKDRYKNAEYVA